MRTSPKPELNVLGRSRSHIIAYREKLICIEICFQYFQHFKYIVKFTSWHVHVILIMFSFSVIFNFSFKVFETGPGTWGPVRAT